MLKGQYLISYIFITSFLLTGCSDAISVESKSDVELVPTSQATSNDTIAAVLDKVSAGDYENFSLGEFENTVFQTEQIDILKYSSEESLEDFGVSFIDIYSAVSDYEYNEENLYFNSLELSEDACFSENLYAHKYSEHKEEIENEGVSVEEYIYMDENHMIKLSLATDYSGSSFTYITDDSLQAFFTGESGADFYNWNPTIDGLSAYKNEVDFNSDDKINFADGELSVSVASDNVNTFTEELSAKLHTEYGLSVNNEQIYVDEENGYELLVSNLSQEYNNIRFEAINSDTLVEGFDEESYSLKMRLRCVSASSQGVCFFIGELPNTKLEVQSSLESLFSPETAIETASSDLTGQTEFLLTDFSLSYLCGAELIEPYWRMCLENQNDGTNVVYLVSCQTGEGMTYQFSDM